MAKSTPKYQALVVVKGMVSIPVQGKTLTDAVTAANDIDWNDARIALGESNDLIDSSMLIVGVEEIHSYRHVND